jgi:PBP1b-binding outer membrane lipoprotein LpoB
MNMLKTLALLAFGSVLLAGCGAKKDESAAQTDTDSPAVESPAPPPEDTMSPADTTDTMPSDEPDPAMSDTLPTDEQPPPPEPAPPPKG